MSNDYLSRQLDWEEAIATSSASLSAIHAELKKLVPALRLLHSIADQYQERWKGYKSLNSPSGIKLEKVEAILGLPIEEFERVIKLIENGQFYVEYCEEIELPKGYGRDSAPGKKMI